MNSLVYFDRSTSFTESAPTYLQKSVGGQSFGMSGKFSITLIGDPLQTTVVPPFSKSVTMSFSWQFRIELSCTQQAREKSCVNTSSI